jgi:hypothetical protein
LLTSGDGYIEVTLAEANLSRIVGLSRGDADQGYADVDFSYEVRNDGLLSVREYGVAQTTVGSYSTGDVLRIGVQGGVVQYWNNGTLLFVSTQPPRYPLQVDTSLYSVNSTVNNAVLAGTNLIDAPENVVWTSAVGVAVSGNNLTKTAPGGWDAGAVSTRQLTSGDGYMEVTLAETNLSRIVGLSRGNTDQGYADVDFSFEIRSDALLTVREFGTALATFGPYATGDILRIAVEGGAVKYYQNATLLYTSSTTPTYPLLVDTSLFSTASTIKEAVMWGITSVPGENVTWTHAVAVAVTGNSLTKSSANAWDGGAVSTRAIGSGDGSVEVIAGETNTDRRFGLSRGDASQHYTDIDYALAVRSDAGLSVWEGSTFVGAVGTYVTGDLLRIVVQGGVVKYYKNATLLYTSTVPPKYPLLVDTALYTMGSTMKNAVISGNLVTAEEPVVWTNAVGVTASGSDLTKTGGAGWDAGASSTRAIQSGDGYMEVTVAEVVLSRIAGLSRGDTDQTKADVDYGVEISADGLLYVWENGVQRSSGVAYAVGDVIRVGVEGGVVRYYRNDTLLYTSTVPPTYPLLLDTSLFETNATLKKASLTGKLQ